MREEIIRMAREAGALVGIKHMTDSTGEMIVFDPDDLERFAALVAAAARERCAKVCEVVEIGEFESPYIHDVVQRCVAAIRAIP